MIPWALGTSTEHLSYLSMILQTKQLINKS